MDLEEREGPDGRTLYVDREEAEKGEEGPFFVVFADREGERRWGYFCGHCETFNNAMDSMGRIQCNECSNFKRPDEWDAAHE